MMDWLVPLISVFASTLVTVTINLVSRNQERKKFYSQLISGNRLSWVEKMRKISAEFLALAELSDRTKEEDKRMLILKNEILLRLNPAGSGNPHDDEARAILMSGELDEDSIETLRNTLNQVFQNQWLRVRYEAGKDALDAAAKQYRPSVK